MATPNFQVTVRHTLRTP